MRIALILVGIIAAPALLPAPASAAGGLPTVSSPEEAVEVAIRLHPGITQGLPLCVEFVAQGLAEYRPEPGTKLPETALSMNIPGLITPGKGGGSTGAEGEYILWIGSKAAEENCWLLEMS